MLAYQSAVLSVLLLSFGSANAFSIQQNAARPHTRLSVANDVTEKQEQKHVPYEISRGDGSTGGGGLPMPNKEANDGLVRPKVRLLLLVAWCLSFVVIYKFLCSCSVGWR